jgi:hypothetical protein
MNLHLFTPSYMFIGAYAANGEIKGSIMRDIDSVEVELRKDEILQLQNDLAASSCCRDTLHVWFVKLRAQRSNLRVAQ